MSTPQVKTSCPTVQASAAPFPKKKKKEKKERACREGGTVAGSLPKLQIMEKLIKALSVVYNRPNDALMMWLCPYNPIIPCAKGNMQITPQRMTEDNRVQMKEFAERRAVFLAHL